MKRILVACGLLTAALLPACATHNGRVQGVTNHDAIGITAQGITALSADDVVRIMRRAGFTDPQILELGPDLRNMLATRGAAEIRIGDKVQALFAVDDNQLHVSSRLRGSFVYPLHTE